MIRYECKCHHDIEDISDILIIKVRDVSEAVRKARELFCDQEYTCMENTSCSCEEVLDYGLE